MISTRASIRACTSIRYCRVNMHHPLFVHVLFATTVGQLESGATVNVSQMRDVMYGMLTDEYQVMRSESNVYCRVEMYVRPTIKGRTYHIYRFVHSWCDRKDCLKLLPRRDLPVFDNRRIIGNNHATLAKRDLRRLTNVYKPSVQRSAPSRIVSEIPTTVLCLTRFQVGQDI